MTNPIIRVHNIETDEIIDRPMTDEEYTQYQIEAAEEQARLNAIVEAETAKQALLTKLGITADEAKLLLS